MKFLLVLACLFVASNALDKEFVEKFMEKLQEIGAKCVVETKASDDDVATLISHQIPNTHEGKCLLFCFYKAFNVQNDDGSFNPEKAIETMQPLKAADEEMYDKVVQVLKKCSDATTVEADPCLTATSMAVCAIREGKALGLKEDLFDFE